ncbi:hypothetical protein AUV02_07780 [Micrococcus sp. CH3]|uniref:hypothetical protein n=2 Tax=unclassified Micrococcus TaxID=2620948 RepID=UPI00077DFD9A|nr:hypothetical protein [Micrococcus sp. CH3]KYK00854.1 hypothetical protein AUV02_07780 [Micrococcus sp. CH3]
MTAPGPHVPVTSSTHAFAITMYIGMVILGLSHVAGVISSRAVEEVLASPWEEIWAGLHLIGPIMAATGALLAAHRKLPIYSMSAELVGCTVFALTKATYVVSLFVVYGIEGGPSTQIMGAGIALGCAARATQVGLELRRLVAAAHATTSPEPAAAPTGR